MQAKLKEPGQQMGVEVVGQGRQAPRQQEEEKEGWQLQRQDGGVESEREGFGSQMSNSTHLLSSGSNDKTLFLSWSTPHHAFYVSYLFLESSQGMLKLLHPHLLIVLNRDHCTLDGCHKLVGEVLSIQAGILYSFGHNLL